MKRLVILLVITVASASFCAYFIPLALVTKPQKDYLSAIKTHNTTQQVYDAARLEYQRFTELIEREEGLNRSIWAFHTYVTDVFGTPTWSRIRSILQSADDTRKTLDYASTAVTEPAHVADLIYLVQDIIQHEVNVTGHVVSVDEAYDVLSSVAAITAFINGEQATLASLQSTRDAIIATDAATRATLRDIGYSLRLMEWYAAESGLLLVFADDGIACGLNITAPSIAIGNISITNDSMTWDSAITMREDVFRMQNGTSTIVLNATDGSLECNGTMLLTRSIDVAGLLDKIITPANALLLGPYTSLDLPTWTLGWYHSATRKMVIRAWEWNAQVFDGQVYRGYLYGVNILEDGLAGPSNAYVLRQTKCILKNTLMSNGVMTHGLAVIDVDKGSIAVRNTSISTHGLVAGGSFVSGTAALFESFHGWCSPTTSWQFGLGSNPL